MGFPKAVKFFSLATGLAFALSARAQRNVAPTFRSASADLKVSATAQGGVATATSAKPFTQEQVSNMVRDGFGDDSGAKLIEQRGIDFAPSEDFIQTLKAAGASEPFLKALRAVKPPEPANAKEPIAGRVRENPKDGLKYVWIPPGSFEMGCPPGDNRCLDNEKPAHPVIITKGFWLGQTEVTVGAYKRFAAATGHEMPKAPNLPFSSVSSGWGNASLPIVNVNWNDALHYCTWAGGRLPTEAEWEYAARAGTTDARYGPLEEIAWCCTNSEFQTHPVGEKRANGFGLYDMLGNALEWVNDWYDENYYKHSPSQDPTGPASGKVRAQRGQSWFSADPRAVRVSSRFGIDPATAEKWDINGVRCAGVVFAP